MDNISTAPTSPTLLPPPPLDDKSVVANWLNQPAVKRYRKEYRNFRVGNAAGAKGDVSDVGFTHFQSSICPPTTNPPPLDDSKADAEPTSAVDQHHPITQWRLAYRRYRLGAAHGAKGSAEDAARIDSIDLLPIVQSFNLKRRLIRPAANISSEHPAPLHVHFGGGKLGIGLILPALVASNIPFVIVQSNSGIYSSLTPPTVSVEVTANGHLSNYKLNVLYLSDNNDDDQKSLLDTALHHITTAAAAPPDDSPPRGLLLLSPRAGTGTTTHPLKHYLYTQRATSFSCSIGPGLPSLANDLKDVRTSAPLYACENDHAGVTKLSELLINCGSSVSVVPCMVDRICTRLDRVSPTEIRAETEPFQGEIVLLNPIDKNALPLAGPTVRVPQIDAQAKYFAERKFLLVNGGHTVLAFLTLLRQTQNDLSPWTPPGHFLLLDWSTMTDHERSVFWCFCLARILLLTWEYDTEVLKNAHQVHTDEDLCDQLLTYAKDGIQRFSAVPDYTSRILAAGVDNRYLGRLKNVLDFLEVSNPASHGIGAVLLRRANVMYCTIVAMVHQFVQQSHQFTRTVKLSFGVNLI